MGRGSVAGKRGRLTSSERGKESQDATLRSQAGTMACGKVSRKDGKTVAKPTEEATVGHRPKEVATQGEEIPAVTRSKQESDAIMEAVGDTD